MNWREFLQKSIIENPYTKDAKAPEAHTLLHILNTPPPVFETGPKAVLSSDALNTHPGQLPRATSWGTWKADMLNRLFQDYGCTQQRGRITPETVEHGERQRRVTSDSAQSSTGFERPLENQSELPLEPISLIRNKQAAFDS
jgi:hypothetical protein